MAPSPRYRIHPRCAWRRLDDHVFVLNEGDDLLTIRDAVGFEVWAALEEGPADIDALVARVVARFEVTEATARADLERFLTRLVEDRALTREDSFF